MNFHTFLKGGNKYLSNQGCYYCKILSQLAEQVFRPKKVTKSPMNESFQSNELNISQSRTSFAWPKLKQCLGLCVYKSFILVMFGLLHGV